VVFWGDEKVNDEFRERMYCTVVFVCFAWCDRELHNDGTVQLLHSRQPHLFPIVTLSQQSLSSIVYWGFLLSTLRLKLR